MSSNPASLKNWSAELATALDLPEGFDTDVALILDLARDAAHAVARPAAPLTTFLVGYAAALRGGSEDDVRWATEVATRLSAEHEAGSGSMQ